MSQQIKNVKLRVVFNNKVWNDMSRLPSNPSKRKFPVVKSSTLRLLLGTALTLTAFMLANTGYLVLNRVADFMDLEFFAVGATSLPKLFQVMVLTHTGIGILLFTIMLIFAVLHLTRVWRRRNESSLTTGLLLVFCGLVLLITGLFILTAAASRDNAWAWWMHVACAAFVIVGYIGHRMVSRTRPPMIKFVKYLSTIVVVLLLLVVGHRFTDRRVVLTPEAQTAAENDSLPGSDSKKKSNIAENGEFVPVGYVSPLSPFFPSAATTTTGDYLPSRIITRGDHGEQEKIDQEIEKYGFVKETMIGAETCARCHQDIVEQWSTSAHRFASFNNPFYEAALEDLRKNGNEANPWIEQHIQKFPQAKDRAGMVKSKWCGGCHDPALMLAGKMSTEVDRRTAEAQAGLTCQACHAIDQIHDVTGNGNYNIADKQEDPYLFANAESGSFGAFLHDTALKAKPTVHNRRMQKPFFSQSEYCATCHKVSLHEPVNNYRWLRGQDEYDNWQDSGVALNAARTFYLPRFKRECQFCHMPPEAVRYGDLSAKNGMVRSHRFLAANTALPFLRGDTTTIRKIETFLRDEKMGIDIFALKSASSQQPIMALNQSQTALRPGEKITLDVVVRNKGVGHTFPGGTTDTNEGWIELSLYDEAGKLLVQSGGIGEDGHLDSLAHVFKAQFLDKHGKRIAKRNAQDIYALVFANVIAPGTADIAHYEFSIPEELKGQTLTVKARLLWRKFDRTYTEFAFFANPQGFKQFKDVPDLPVTEIAADEIKLIVGENAVPPVAKRDAINTLEWIRFNDYGIGLLLEGDTRGARLAFEQVEKRNPESIEGPLNLAKTAVRDGNIDLAFQHLKKCEELKPGNARVAWVWAVALQEDGQYEKAVQAYQRVLQTFPDDRASWRNLGRSFYLNQQYEKSLEAFDQVLRIDPEDRTAHYHRMLCLRSLGRSEEAETVAKAYAFYQVNESAQNITRAFRAKNPGANLMAQAIRTHALRIQLDR